MRAETKWAVIASVVVFLWLIVQMLLGLQTPENLATLSLASMIVSTLIFITVYFMVTREKRDRDLDGFMTWKQGFWTAAIMTLIFIPISSLLLYIFLTAINPELAPLLTGSSIEKDPVGVILSDHVLFAIFGGLIFSLLFPLFTRRTAKT